ncbi:hypothetical protein SAMN02745213_00608 [Succinivibrio dextrinosolvens DSM 3072]|uniref:Uncharacterized protein n=1 Tax=Succinivibrio dextrinosolvens DSM 3072 TaxID=1123324 RepID=A0A1T4V2K8_9GAMM|nr:hypothetical protein [Succinivibrio dextrinosolvens]SKA59107.1 hypothetical protein SAMN02745213_00608 [Succinivibrio dextrinosolvens DSM 3072]
MSDFSIKNRINIDNVQFQNQNPKPEDKAKTDKNVDNDAVSFNSKLDSQKIDSQDIISGKNPQERLKTLMDRVMSNGQSEETEKFDKKFFLLNLKNSLVNSAFGNTNANLQKMQMEASECDLKFKEKCIEVMKKDENIRSMGMLYKSSTTNAQRAYLDLMTAFLLTSQFKAAASAKGDVNIPNGFLQQMQCALAEHISAGAKDVSQTEQKANDILDKLPDNIKNTCKEQIKKFKDQIAEISENKRNAVEDIKKRSDDLLNIQKNLKGLNPDTFRPTELRFTQNKADSLISPYCGVNSCVHLDEETAAQFKELKNELGPKFQEVVKLHHDIESYLKSPNIKGSSLKTLAARVENDANGNTFLLEKLQAHSRSAFESIGARIVSLVDNPVSNANLGSELTKIADEIQRHLLPEHAKPLAKIISLNLTKLQLGVNGLTETPNLLALRNLMGKISSDPNLQNNFPALMSILGQARFDFKGFALLSGSLSSEDIKNNPKSMGDKSTEVLEAFCRCLDNPAEGNAFVDKLAGVKVQDKSIYTAFAAMGSYLSHSPDEKVVQKCGKYLNLNLVKQAAALDLKQNNLDLSSVPPSPDEIKSNPKLLEDEQINIDLNMIVNSSIKDIDSATLKRVLNCAVTGKLPHLNTIWNTLLHSAYHSEMAEKLERNEITDVPKRVFSISTEESSPIKELIPEKKSSGYKARQEFKNSLSEEVRNRMYTQSTGLFRKQEQQKNLDAITEKLNAMSNYNTDILEALGKESTKGKIQLALDEMRKELTFINSSILTGGPRQFDNIKSEEDLLKVAVDKGALLDGINSKYKGMSDKYAQIIKEKNTSLQNPIVSKLLEAQGLMPGDKPSGQDVAVTLITLRDNLIDDITKLSESDLKAIGITSPENLKFSAEEKDFAVKLNQYLGKRNLMELSGITLPPSAEFSDDKIQSFYQKCDTALSELSEIIATQGKSVPLTKTAKLALNKYIEISLMRHGDSYAQFVAKDEGSKYILNQGNTSEKTLKEAQNLTFEKAFTIDSKIQNMLNGNIASEDADLRAVKNLILNNLAVNAGLKRKNLNAFINTTNENQKLSNQEKKELINKLKLLRMNVDTGSFATSDPRDSKPTKFSSDLRELSKAEGAEFEKKLDEFIATHLTSETTSQADAVLTYATQSSDPIETTLKTIKTAFDEDTKLDSGVLKKVTDAFTSDYQKNVGSVSKKSALYESAQNEQAQALGEKLLGDRNVRAIVRLAGSYAAASLGYSGRNEVIEAYKSDSTSEEEKARIENAMKKALIERGFDANLADMLTRAKLIEGKSDHLIARGWSILKNTFFSIVSTVQSRVIDRFEGDYQEKLRKNQNFERYLPCVKEMINSITPDTVKYVDKSKDMAFKFDPLKAVDAVTGGTLTENGVVSLKMGLSLLKNSGVIFNRDEDGKLSISINTNTLVGVSVEAGVDLLQAGGAGAEVGVKGGFGKVLNLKFDSDDEAAVFVCKMFTGQLSSNDVKLSESASAGTSGSISGGAKASADIGNISKYALYGDEIEANSEIEGVDADSKFAEDHPVVNTILSNGTIGKAEIEANLGYDTKTVVDNSGVITEKHRKWTLNIGFTAFEFADNINNIKEETLDKVADKIEPLKAVYDVSEKINSTVSNILTKPIEAMGIDYIENFHTVHVSDITGAIDYATDKTVSNRLKDEHLETLKKEGLLNDALDQKLEEANQGEQILNVTFEMKLKDDVIDKFSHDPTALAKEADNFKKNYEFSSFSVELKGTENKIEYMNWLKLVSGGMLSYSSKTTATGNTLITIVKNEL